MTLKYGTVAGEKPGKLHRLGTISGRSCCGKAIVVLPPGERPKLVVCGRCKALDEARREGIPEWFSD
jgi:hypothetical protein